MCGIAGVLRFDGSQVEPGVLEDMNRVLAHRGPDGAGIWHSGPLGLAHRRLAIQDLSPAGKQPMADGSGRLSITYNGEIYNFRELRAELQGRGHRFESRSDTEVILKAYAEWGPGCLERFNGMFAFALWDARERRLWLVRDRLGIKPLFVARLPEALVFASEIKAILEHPGVGRRIDPEALAYYAALNYTPAPFTLFKQVRQLLPGQYLLAGEDGSVREVQYWDLRYSEKGYREPEHYLERFGELLEDAVRARLVADVPVGVFLSGGMDSGSIAYWAARHALEPLRSFSMGFEEKTYNELPFARAVARSLHTRHDEGLVPGGVESLLPRLVWHAEEPTADSSMVAFYHLSGLARSHVKVALSGDGADEILAGYETYQAYFLHQAMRRLPFSLARRLMAPAVRALPSRDNKVSLDFKLKRFAAGLAYPGEDAHATWRMIFDARARLRLLSPVAGNPGSAADALDLFRQAFARSGARHPLNRMLYVDTRLYLPNDMLVKVDRMSMAHGLEVRVPFLDFRLVEFLASVPPGLKLRRFLDRKHLLRRHMLGRLPGAVLRRRKQGFNVPNARWLRGDLKPFVTDCLSPAAVREMGVLDPAEVERLLRGHFREGRDYSHQLWCLLVLSLWWRRFRPSGVAP